ncbi:MAG: transcriptional regulator [Betaproteobacteria bacterium HGW-Betaproteobacteria-13]|jgi:DNA-binding transcriptional LysR family regulator|uniref:Transcriptional regulator n=1 Tax=Parazoarcus communis TaxID=41977 RepID=A0A2U8GXZ0_9RHOO|nr:LysR family transcriptional regulator [Parazoarcus communis]AWI78314.1 transcriptional regulator [Parazoarcus communis]PKO55143.1 MAG: transcriptional regulator [Betaproteobacteria bacterium HGW-Betaproteobacteria-21]PKO82342.1 MAG: transcriptional regulator [Betaproteobacteria bacterium HGW-Betaproteobacteria-13]
MELVALRTFQAVVEEGGILAASRKLNTVQSNVTNRIQRLEQELGAELFFRKGRGMELAPSGRVLLDYARQMLQLERQTSAAVRLVGESTGELRVGSMETFAALHLPSALRAVRAAHPGLELRVQTQTSAALTEMVVDHKLDCAFVAGPVMHADLHFDEVVVEELVQVSASGTNPVSQPLIIFREGCAYRTRALSWQRASGSAMADAMEFGTLEGILGCVAVGLGWTLMPRRVVEQSAHFPDLVIETLPEEFAHVPTGMIRLRSAAPMAAIETLSNAVRAAS